METSWPLASTSTTSTSRMEHATCSTSHNHDFLHLPSSMVHHQHSQSGHVNSGPTSTSVSSSTSTCSTSHTMRRNLLQQTSWYFRQQQEHVKIQRSYDTELVSKRFKQNEIYLKRNVGNMQPSTPTSRTPTTTSTHNKIFRMLQPQQYVEQVNSSATSSRMLQSRVANQTTYFDDFNEPTSVGKCFDNSDINMQQEPVYNSTPCYRASYILNLDGQKHHNNNSFKNGYKTSQHTR